MTGLVLLGEEKLLVNDMTASETQTAAGAVQEAHPRVGGWTNGNTAKKNVTESARGTGDVGKKTLGEICLERGGAGTEYV